MRSPTSKPECDSMTAAPAGRDACSVLAAAAIVLFVVDGLEESFDASLGLFSVGLTVARTTMNLLRTSNQKGAPSEIPKIVSNQPARAIIPATTFSPVLH